MRKGGFENTTRGGRMKRGLEKKKDTFVLPRKKRVDGEFGGGGETSLVDKEKRGKKRERVVFRKRKRKKNLSTIPTEKNWLRHYGGDKEKKTLGGKKVTINNLLQGKRGKELAELKGEKKDLPPGRSQRTEMQRETKRRQFRPIWGGGKKKRINSLQPE